MSTGRACGNLWQPTGSMARVAQLPKEGDQVAGQYVLGPILGRGATGVVYEAHQTSLNRKVALKMLLPKLLGSDGIAERFKREARLASSLTHPNSVAIYAYGVHGQAPGVLGLPFIAMEYLEGEDLHEYLGRVGPMELDDCIDVCRQALESLADAHAKGIIHRDLKPENLFLCQGANGERVVKVLDFGIAKALTGEWGSLTRRLTQTGMMCGTPEYMAPEQATGQKDITPSVDCYAIGCIAYQMLTGEPPFTAPSPFAVALKHLSQPVPDLPDKYASTAFAGIMKQALGKQPDQRFRDAAHFLAVLVGRSPSAVIQIETTKIRPGAAPAEEAPTTEPEIVYTTADPFERSETPVNVRGAQPTTPTAEWGDDEITLGNAGAGFEDGGERTAVLDKPFYRAPASDEAPQYQATQSRSAPGTSVGLPGLGLSTDPDGLPEDFSFDDDGFEALVQAVMDASIENVEAPPTEVEPLSIAEGLGKHTQKFPFAVGDDDDEEDTQQLDGDLNDMLAAARAGQEDEDDTKQVRRPSTDPPSHVSVDLDSSVDDDDVEDQTVTMDSGRNIFGDDDEEEATQVIGASVEEAAAMLRSQGVELPDIEEPTHSMRGDPFAERMDSVATLDQQHNEPDSGEFEDGGEATTQLDPAKLFAETPRRSDPPTNGVGSGSGAGRLQIRDIESDRSTAPPKQNTPLALAATQPVSEISDALKARLAGKDTIRSEPKFKKPAPQYAQQPAAAPRREPTPSFEEDSGEVTIATAVGEPGIFAVRPRETPARQPEAPAPMKAEPMHTTRKEPAPNFKDMQPEQPAERVPSSLDLLGEQEPAPVEPEVVKLLHKPIVERANPPAPTEDPISAPPVVESPKPRHTPSPLPRTAGPAKEVPTSKRRKARKPSTMTRLLRVILGVLIFLIIALGAAMLFVYILPRL